MSPTIHWPPRGYDTVTTAAAKLGLSRQRVHALLRSRGIATEPTDHGVLIRTRDLAALRERKPGRPKAKTRGRR